MEIQVRTGRLKRPLKEGGREKISRFCGPLHQGTAPICPTLTFERISDYTGESGSRGVPRASPPQGLWLGSGDTPLLQQ